MDFFPLKLFLETSLTVQWLGLCTLTAEGLGSIPGWGTKMPQAARHSQKKKKNPQTKNKLKNKNQKISF